MSLTQINEHTFIDVENATAIHFVMDSDDPKATVRFKDGGVETVTGQAAHSLLRYLGDSDQRRLPEQPDVLETPSVLKTPSDPGLDSNNEEGKQKPFRVRMVVAPVLGRKKAWFYRTDDGRGYFLAFVNAKGSCSVRTFDATSGIYLGKRYLPGNYQQQFADLITGAVEITVENQPNLERDCKQRLPQDVFQYLRNQINSR